jgi:hypothetical protein
VSGVQLTARGESAFTGLIVAGLFVSGVLVIAALVGALALFVAFLNWIGGLGA